MIKVIMAVFLAVVITAIVLLVPASIFKAIALLLVVFGLLEFCGLFSFSKTEKLFTSGVGTILAFCMLFPFEEDVLAMPLLLLLVFLLAVFFMWRLEDLKEVVNRLMLSSLGLLYVAAGISMWGWLRDLNYGQYWVLLTFASAGLSDSFAYVVGKSIGRHKLAPVISPNKTVEGFFGALLGAFAGVFLIYIFFLSYVPWWHFVIISFAVWLLASLGDLFESVLKRSVGVKDSGSIIPGHGGILDRLDALLFTGAFVFVYVVYFI